MICQHEHRRGKNKEFLLHVICKKGSVNKRNYFIYKKVNSAFKETIAACADLERCVGRFVYNPPPNPGKI